MIILLIFRTKYYYSLVVTTIRHDYTPPANTVGNAALGIPHVEPAVTRRCKTLKGKRNNIWICTITRDIIVIPAHTAHQQIALDLDEGVRVNYAGFQSVVISTDDGRIEKMDLLARIQSGVDVMQEQIASQRIIEISQKVLQAAKDTLGDKLDKVILYGSYARGDYDDESDIDFIVLAHVPQEEAGIWRNEINKRIPYIDLDYDILVSVKVTGSAIFNQYVDSLPFYSNVVREGVVLHE